MQTIAIYHSKGGVGKTTTAVNLSYLAAQDAPTLICDLDAQASATFYFRVKAKFKSGARGFIRGGDRVWQNIKASNYPDLDLLPADLRFRSMDLRLDESKNARKRLPKILNTLSGEYRYTFLDCPPNLSRVSENIFNGADIILVPVIPTTLSIRSFEQVRLLFQKKGFDTGKLFVFFSMLERRKKLHKEIVETVRRDHKQVLDTAIPYRSDIEKMGLERAPVCHYAPRSPSANAYRELWTEVRRVLDEL